MKSILFVTLSVLCVQARTGDKFELLHTNKPANETGAWPHPRWPGTGC